MPNWLYDVGTGGATSVQWSTEATSSTGYYSYRINNDLISTGKYSPPRKVDPEIKRKKFLQHQPELHILKVPDLKLFDTDRPDIELEASKVEYDTIKSIGRIKDQHVFEIYDVPEAPYNADTDHYRDGIEARGLKKTSMGFYIQDDSIKFAFRRRKILELRQPPAFIPRYRFRSDKFTEQEMKARTLLKRYVGEKEYKRYRQVGYIVLNAHGFMWRVPGENSDISRIEQFLKGKRINTYCVHFKDDKIPPTDACLMRMAFIHGGIDMLKSYSNVCPIIDMDLKIEKKVTVPVLTFAEVVNKVKLEYKL